MDRGLLVNVAKKQIKLVDLIEAGDLNTGDVLQKDCLWFCFLELLQEDLGAV